MNTSIDKFFGLNMNETGDTQLGLGESGKMINFRITKDNKLEKMYGYEEKYKKSGIVRAQWVGKLGNTHVHIYVCGGKVYNGDDEIGELTDDVTSIFEFNKKLYFLNGHEYKSYDGVILADVEGYIPLIKIATTPNGVGSELEPINVLTGKKHQTFSPDGTARTFQLAESNVDSIDRVLLDGVETTVTSNLTKGTITFSTAPAQAADNIDVYWTKGQGQRELVVKNQFAETYGLADDTRVFLYGNEDAVNRIYFSDLGNGVPNVEYFPGTNFIDIGSSNTAVTDISRQYDLLIISKENETYYSSYEMIDGIIAFPTYPLNKSHGMVAKGQGQLLDNFVTTIDTSIVQWVNTQSKDERNAQVISTKIQEWLNSKDLPKAVTLDYQEDKEYWIAIGDEIMIYNYFNGCYFLLKIPVKITSMYSSNGVIYIGTENGEIMEFSKSLTSYNGEIINAEWQMGFYDFGVEERRKTMRILWLAMKPHTKTSVRINYLSDRDMGTDEKEISNRCFDTEYVNFTDFSFNTLRSVKPHRVKLKAKKFAFLKLILKNEKLDEKLTINSIAIKQAIGGEVK